VVLTNPFMPDVPVPPQQPSPYFRIESGLAQHQPSPHRRHPRRRELSHVLGPAGQAGHRLNATPLVRSTRARAEAPGSTALFAVFETTATPIELVADGICVCNALAFLRGADSMVANFPNGDRVRSAGDRPGQRSSNEKVPRRRGCRMRRRLMLRQTRLDAK